MNHEIRFDSKDIGGCEDLKGLFQSSYQKGLIIVGVERPPPRGDSLFLDRGGGGDLVLRKDDLTHNGDGIANRRLIAGKEKGGGVPEGASAAFSGNVRGGVDSNPIHGIG